MTDSSTPSRPLAILVLDGGGLQAVSTLYTLRTVLQKIAEEKWTNNEPRPCDVFDVIAGIGVGGWLAILLGRFRMSITSCLLEWSEMNWNVRPKSDIDAFHKRIVKNRIIDKDRLMAVIDHWTEEYRTSDYLFEDDPQGARTRHVLVAAPTWDAGGYNLFRSYEIPASAKLPEKLLDGPENPDSFKISDAFAATGATRYLTASWKGKMANSGETKFKDRKFPEPHNITELALNEMYGIYGTDVPLSAVVNIGPGLPNRADVQLIERRYVLWTSDPPFHPPIDETNPMKTLDVGPTKVRGIDTNLVKLRDDIDNDIKKMLDDEHPGNADLYYHLAPRIAPWGSTYNELRWFKAVTEAIQEYLNEPRVIATMKDLAKRMVRSDRSH